MQSSKNWGLVFIYHFINRESQCVLFMSFMKTFFHNKSSGITLENTINKTYHYQKTRYICHRNYKWKRFRDWYPQLEHSTSQIQELEEYYYNQWN
jgi:hypothetical protein